MLLVKFITRNKIIVLIVFITFLLRVLNPTFGSPTLYIVGDEVSNYMSAWAMIAEKSLINRSSPYPPLGSYIQIPFFILSFLLMLLSQQIQSVSEFTLFLVSHEGFFLFIPRILSALFAATTIYVEYLISLQLFPKNKTIAYWSALFFAFSTIHMQTTHFARPWSFALFFAALSFLFAVKSVTERENEKVYIFFAGISMILTAGFLQSWVYALFLFLLIRTYDQIKNGFRKTGIILTLATTILVVISAVIFMKLTLYKVSTDNFDWGIRGTMPIIKYFAHPQGSIFTALYESFISQGLYLYNLYQLLHQEPLLLGFMIFGICSIKAWRGKMIAVTLYSIILFLAQSALLDYHIRHLLPTWIGFCLLGGIGMYEISQHIKKNSVKNVFFALVIIAISLIPVYWNYIFIQQTTFTKARMWINQNLNSEQKFACIGVRFCGYTPTIPAIEIMQKYTPNAFDRAKIVQATAEKIPDNVKNMVIIGHFSGKTNKEKYETALKEYNFEYVLDYYWDPQDSLENTLKNSHIERIQHFSPLKGHIEKQVLDNMVNTIEQSTMIDTLLKIDRPGPYIDILKVK